MVAQVTDIETREDVSGDDYYRRLALAPAEGTFALKEFLSAPVLETMAQKLIEKHSLPADEFTIDFFWKRKSGNSGGRPVLGKVVKLSGLAKHYSDGSEFAVWIAANHVRDLRMTNYQLEAALFHQLLHIAHSEDGDGELIPIVKAPEFTGYIREVEEYGDWRADLSTAKEAFTQAKLIPDGYLQD